VTLARLAERLRARELSPREAVQVYLDRIEAHADLNAYITVRAEEALAEADEVRSGPLYGVPIAVKDVIDVAGTRTTAASKILADNVARTDAAAVERLRRAGAVLLGKLNLHEFAYGALTTSPHFGPVRNPWAPDRVCGGSSGGNGAAVAADLAAGTLGTDTAGSIRIPACFCGATGLRPSTGRVSNRGVFPVSWTFDTVGPVARTAEDCALLLEAVAGHDPADATTARASVPRYREELDRGIGGLRLGVVEALLDDADERVAAAVRRAIGELGALGAHVEAVEIPLLREAGTIQQLVMLPEASSVHLGWLRTRLGDYGADVRARLLAGLLIPPTASVTGQRARRWYCDALSLVLERFDVLAAPAMPLVAPRIGEDTVDLGGRSIAYRLALIPYNSPWSLAGLPVVSVPCGFVDGLPVGMSLVGRRLAEGTVLRAAHAFQGVTDWHAHRPAAEAAVI
jgi:aspartyl-tRNA(Asn)/glutamyl-tRNA(Gln) amidotransferase subunit A